MDVWRQETGFRGVRLITNLSGQGMQCTLPSDNPILILYMNIKMLKICFCWLMKKRMNVSGSRDEENDDGLI